MMLGLVALPGLGLGLEGCAGVRDPAQLPAPEQLLAAAQAAGLDLAFLEGPRGESSIPSAEACEGTIRPGARLHIEGQWLCTANWVFRDAQGALYLGTAGHCIPHLGVTRIELPGLGDIGDPVYTTGDAGVGRDFALLRIDAALHGRVDPTLCRWGGPRGIAGPSDGPGRQQPVLHYGWGAGWGALPETRARAGLLPGFGWSTEHVVYAGATAPGDSGSPLMNPDGLAIGIHTHTSGAANVPGAGVGQKYGTRLDVALQRAELALGRGLDLVTSPAPVDLTGLSRASSGVRIPDAPFGAS